MMWLLCFVMAVSCKSGGNGQIWKKQKAESQSTFVAVLYCKSPEINGT